MEIRSLFSAMPGAQKTVGKKDARKDTEKGLWGFSAKGLLPADVLGIMRQPVSGSSLHFGAESGDAVVLSRRSKGKIVLTLENIRLVSDRPDGTTPLAIQQGAQPQQKILKDTQTGQTLASVTIDESKVSQSRMTLDFVETKKGDLTAVIRDESGTVYLGLPGSNMSVGGYQVEMAGEPMAEGQALAGIEPPQAQLQDVTNQAMVLGAGIASRFRPLGDLFAKPGAPLVGNKSVIYKILEHLQDFGVNRFAINTCVKPNHMKSGLTDFASQITYIDESRPSGTAGAMIKALIEPEKYPGAIDFEKPLLIVQGDAVTNADFRALLNAHRDNNAAVTIGGMVQDEVNGVSQDGHFRVGIIRTDRSGLDGASGRITKFLEKPHLDEAGEDRLGSTGFYVLSPRAMKLIPKIYADVKAARGKDDIHDVIPDFANDLFPVILEKTLSGEIKDDKGNAMPMWAQQVDGYWDDIGNPPQYLQTLHNVYAGQLGFELPESQSQFFENGVAYLNGARSRVDASGAELKGNVIVAIEPAEKN